MASYHRVLETFGRSVHDNTLECDTDIHPWEISIDGEQWAGKIRLIGFVDVFFLFSYSANARFEHGIIVYKDKLDIEELEKHMPKKTGRPEHRSNPPQASGKQGDTEPSLDDMDHDPDQPNAEANTTNGQGSQPEEPTKDTGKTDDPAVAEFRKTSVFSTRSLGHPVGLRVSYPKSSIRFYKVEITKPCSWAQSKRIMRGLKPHSIYDLMSDVIRCGIITQGQLVGHVLGVLLAGTRLDDMTKKYVDGLTSGNDAGRQALSNEKI
ncbi:hypothetical protein PENARI_c010G09204 [Penicillium arizonense]|uniref:Uncharacterized protein n=1 Tax=Penicillium arizonense TaxID=1835702 RepID=A0A1F5LHT4_PENAI|nr:hypothetical protein PENARI_c010G09204 [Penicillium arizonense]OGE52570.1 hypothetical protein PENARI_c010G09204 [Penicillium arizonense]